MDNFYSFYIFSNNKYDKIYMGVFGKRKLRTQELHVLYYSPSVIRIIKSRRMRWAEHVARIGEKRNSWVTDRKTRGIDITRKAKT
jgi:hypothetical protein